MSRTPQSTLTYSRITEDVLRMLDRPSAKWWALFIPTAMLVLVGAACFFYQAVTGLGVAGYSHPVFWGVYIADFVFWIEIAHSGTLISAILYLFRARFRMSICRIAEGMTVFAVLTAALFPVVHLGRCWNFLWLIPYPNSRELWINFKSPLAWDVFAVSTYFTVSLTFFVLGMIPDMATIRDRVKEPLRKVVYSLLSFGWKGTHREWIHYTRAYLFFAAIATALVFSVHSIVSWDFAVGNVPGWHTTIFPPYFLAGAVLSGMALIVMLTVPLRKIFRLEDYITIDSYDGMAKMIMLASSTIAYSYASEFFMAWYSGNPYEWGQFVYRAKGEYALFCWLIVICNCLVPMALWWEKVRKNVTALFAISMVITVGMWFERFNIIAISLSRDFEPGAWGVYKLSLVEAGITVGSFAWFFMFFLIFVKTLPSIPIAEMKEMIPVPKKGD